MIIKRFDIVLKDIIPPFKKIIEVDSDKSISIRSFLIGSLGQNISKAKMYSSQKTLNLLSTALEN